MRNTVKKRKKQKKKLCECPFLVRSGSQSERYKVKADNDASPKIKEISSHDQPVRQQLSSNFTSLYGYENRRSNQQLHGYKRVMAQSFVAIKNRIKITTPNRSDCFPTNNNNRGQYCWARAKMKYIHVFAIVADVMPFGKTNKSEHHLSKSDNGIFAYIYCLCPWDAKQIIAMCSLRNKR